MRTIILTIIAAAVTVSVSAQADSATLYLNKGKEELVKGRTLEAWKKIDKAYAFNKTDKEVVSALAKVLFDLRRYPLSREKYLELEKMGDQSADTYKNLMQLSYNLRQFPDAIKYAGLVAKLDPSAKTAFIIGKSNYDLESYGEAVKYLTLAQKEEPQNAEIAYYIARSYADQYNYKNAVTFFQKAIELDPKNTRWMYEAGLIYYAMGDAKNSLKYIQLAGDNGYRKDNEYMTNLAIAHLNNKDFDKAIEIFKSILEKRPADMQLLNTVAEAHYDAKKYDDAITYWDKILELDKTNASALFMIGMSYQKKGDKAKGQALCDKAIQMDPSLARNRQKMEMPGGL